MGLTGSTVVKESVHYDAFEANLPSTLVRGKTVAITGCTSGTGLIAAQCAARKGAAHILMLNRPSARAVAAERLVQAAIDDCNKDDGAADGSTTTKTQVETIPCDLQDFASVRQCAETIRAKYNRLDVLCNNAGVMALEDKATPDGYDVQMQTNHLSHFLLTSLLLPLLSKSGDDGATEPARIVFHSSMIRKGSDLQRRYFSRNVDGNLGGNGNNMFLGGARWERYHQTKLANYVMTAALAEKLAAAAAADGGSNQNVMAVCAAPGFAATNLQLTCHQDGGMGTTGMWAMRFAQSAEDGAMPLIHAMFGPNVANGDFYEPKGGMKGLPTKYPLTAQALDEAQKKLLWEASEEACGPFGL